MSRQDKIRLAYIKPEKEDLISHVTVTENFLDLVSGYAEVLVITATPETMDLAKLESIGTDYLLADVKNFGALQFMLREKNKINLKFVLILHTVFGWFQPLVQIIPLLRKNDVIIAPSEYARRSFLRISPRICVRTIPHCLDVIKIQKYTKDIQKPRSRQIGFMGRLSREKGLEELIESLPGIISRCGDVDLNLIGPLSGDRMHDNPESGYVKYLKRLATRLGIGRHVNFMGMRLGGEKYMILSRLSAFVFPTVYRQETFGVPMLEAMACGIPVITTDFAVGRELIRNGHNGYLIKTPYDGKNGLTFDKKELISLVSGLLQNKKRAVKIGDTARRMALQYDSRKIMPRFIGILKRNRSQKFYSQKWRSLKNKRIIDCKNLYDRRALFFILLTDFADKTFMEMYSDSMSHHGRAKRRAGTRWVFAVKVSEGLFDYLSRG